jgi:molecular chaperone GrpE (heat shock protein)
MPGAQPAAEAPAAEPQATPTPVPTTQEPPAPKPSEPDSRPPWEKSGQPFDAERAWKLIQNKEKDLADLKAKTEPIVAEWEQLRRASQTDQERLTEDLNSVTAERDNWRNRAIRADARALADRFIDADAALALIGDLSEFAGADGVDTSKLTARFDALAADKPHLVKADPQPPGFTPNRAQGQSGNGALTPSQMASQAEASGDFKTAGRLKAQQLLDMKPHGGF